MTRMTRMTKMRKSLAAMALLAAVMGASACSTVTLKEKGVQKLAQEPSHEEKKSFFLFGLIGEHHVQVKDLCQGKAPRQIQAQDTVTDSLLMIVTLGIYRPRTVKVWCPS